MIAGMGIDIIEVERVSEKIERAPGFREFVFSPAEIEYCDTKKHKYEHFAARFAAKEAFYKAIGSGWVDETAFNEVEILNDEKGMPYINLIGATQVTLSALNITKMHVSLTHIKSTAAAVVIIEK